MGSKTEAIISDSDRFFQYLSDSEKKTIFAGKTKAERLHRLKNFFESFFISERDARGSHFIESDLLQDPDYPIALEKLYNCASAKEYRDKHFPELPQRVTAETVREALRVPIKPPVIAEQPKKLISIVRGYFNKAAGKNIKPYNRTIPQKWEKRQEKFILSRLQEKNIKLLAEKMNMHFGTQRTLRSVQTKRIRLLKAVKK